MTQAITVLQPWASLIALGEKEFETRSWSTPYRGTLVIHAGKSDEYLGDSYNDAFRAVWKKHGIKRGADLPLGSALCFCELVDCIRMDWKFIDALTEQEEEFGLYAPGRYAWKLANIRVIPGGIPIGGAQGLWDWEQRYYLKYASLPTEKDEPKTPEQLRMFDV